MCRHSDAHNNDAHNSDARIHVQAQAHQHTCTRTNAHVHAYTHTCTGTGWAECPPGLPLLILKFGHRGEYGKRYGMSLCLRSRGTKCAYIIGHECVHNICCEEQIGARKDTHKQNTHAHAHAHTHTHTPVAECGPLPPPTGSQCHPGPAFCPSNLRC